MNNRVRHVLGGLPAELRDMLLDFRESLLAALQDNLVGLYVFGSLVAGDFEPAASDVDFLAVTGEPVREAERLLLAALHVRLSRSSPWGSRLEGGYAARRAVQATGITAPIVAVESGEELRSGVPGNYAADDMIGIREQGIALYGPPASEIISPVDQAMLRTALQEYLADLVSRPIESRSAHILATWALNIARCIYGLQTGKPATKMEAATWLSRQSPTTEPILRSALAMRQGRLDSGFEHASRAGLPALRRAAAECLDALTFRR
jgi:predicted nucleotidyltransferase